jgi:sulfur-oxidizing protein SoxY
LFEINAVPGRPALIQAQIRHPNDSGLAMDQLTRMYTPAHYVRHMRVSHAGHDVMTADLDISISENPEFQFYAAGSDVTVTFTDNTDQTWSAQQHH